MGKRISTEEITKINEAIKKIEANTSFRHTALTDEGSAFFVTVAKDGETVISPAMEFDKAKIFKLAEIKRPASAV